MATVTNTFLIERYDSPQKCNSKKNNSRNLHLSKSTNKTTGDSAEFHVIAKAGTPISARTIRRQQKLKFTFLKQGRTNHRNLG